MIRPAHTLNSPVTWLTVASDNTTLASRSGTSTDARVLVWNLNKITSSSTSSTHNTALLPILELSNLPNDYPTANVDFSPDGKFLCCGTTPIKRSTTTVASGSSSNTAVSSSSAPNSSLITDNGAVVLASNNNSAEDDDITSTSSFIYFYNIEQAIQTYQKTQPSSKTITSAAATTAISRSPLQIEPNLKITVARGVSAIMVKWQPKTNQIFCRYDCD